LLFDILLLSSLLYCIIDFVPQLDFVDGIELDAIAHIVKKVKVFLEFRLP